MSTVVVATGALCREVTSVEHEVSGERVGVTVGSFGHRRVVLSGDRLVFGSGWLRLQGIPVLREYRCEPAGGFFDRDALSVRIILELIGGHFAHAEVPAFRVSEIEAGHRSRRSHGA